MKRPLLSAGTVAVLVLSWGYLLYMDWGMRHMERGAEMRRALPVGRGAARRALTDPG